MKLSLPHSVDQWFNNLVKRPALAVIVSILWMILLGWVAYGWNLGSTGLVDETEPLFAEASRQMYVTGDWITPFFNGETRFDKPALIYWCQAIAYKMIGVNEWAVRLPSAIAAMAVIALGFYTTYWSLKKEDELKQIARPTRRYLIAALAAALIALSPEMIVWGRTGVSDMLLTGCMASALLCFFLGYAGLSGEQGSGGAGEQGSGGAGEQGSRGGVLPIPNTSLREATLSNPQSPIPNNWYLAFYVLVAGAILTKGPVGIVLPGLIVVAFLLYVGKLREVLCEMRPLVGTLIVLGLSVPWYVLVIWRNGWNYINSFFGYHNLERFTEVVNGHSAPWYFYFLVVLLGFAPYSIYLPLAMARLKFWRRSHWCSQERSQQLSLFAGIWFICVFGFFTIAVTKLPSYVLPLMPASAILVALLWGDFSPVKNQATEISRKVEIEKSLTASSPALIWSGWANVIFLTVISVAMFHLSQLLGRDQAAPDLRQLLEDSGITKLGGFIWLFSAAIGAFLILGRRWYSIISLNLLGFVAFLIIVLMPAMFLLDQQRQLPLRELSAVVMQVQQPKEELVMVGFKKPSVVFYSHKHINFIKLTKLAVEYIQKQANQELKPTSLLILTEKKNFFKMNLEPDDYQVLDIQGAYQLIRVNFKKMKNEKLNVS